MSKRKRMKNSNKSRGGEGGVLATNADGGNVVPTNCFTADILPPELWELIFKNVESPKDLVSCWNTTSAWAAALRSTDFQFKMIFPFILPYLSRRDLLACSSVSKSWNSTVDVCVQIAEDVCSDSRLKSEQRMVLKLSSQNMPAFQEKFLSSMNDAGEYIPVVNAVAFRRVAVELWLGTQHEQPNPERDPNPLIYDRRKLLSCLHHHGHEIRHLHLGINDTTLQQTISCLDKLKLIRSCLQLTPNLRVLVISTLSFDDDEIEEPRPNFDPEPSNVYILQHSWPALEHLKVLTFDYSARKEEFASMANAYSDQLISLQFGFKLVSSLRPLSNTFFCLQKIVYLFCVSCSGMEFAGFVRYSQCSLKQLIVVFSSPYPADTEHYKGLTMAANAASATLETLGFYPWIGLIEGLNFDIKKFDQLRLPKLKTLNLSDFGYPSFDFLQKVCPALEELIVSPSLPNHGGYKMREPGQIYCDLYSEHQFWKELAHIQSVDVLYMFDAVHVLVDGKRNGNKIRKKIPGGKVRKNYTRRGYEAKLKEDRATGNDNHSSASEDQSGDDNASASSSNVLITRSKKVYKRMI